MSLAGLCKIWLKTKARVKRFMLATKGKWKNSPSKNYEGCFFIFLVFYQRIFSYVSFYFLWISCTPLVIRRKFQTFAEKAFLWIMHGHKERRFLRRLKDVQIRLYAVYLRGSPSENFGPHKTRFLRSPLIAIKCQSKLWLLTLSNSYSVGLVERTPRASKMVDRRQF